MPGTEFAFVLPVGYVDSGGTVHRDGVMRLAHALDEIEPFSDPRVKANEGYFGILLLSRVVVRLGSLPQLTPQVIERLFARDYAFLQELFVQLNSLEKLTVVSSCPRCSATLQLDPWK